MKSRAKVLEHMKIQAKLLEQGKYVDAVIDLVCTMQGVTFVEIQEMLSPYVNVEGDMLMYAPECSNIIFWLNMSQELLDIIEKVLKSGKVYYKRMADNNTAYQLDGKIPEIPIAVAFRDYQKPRWMPIVFHPGDKRSTFCSCRLGENEQLLSMYPTGYVPFWLSHPDIARYPDNPLRTVNSATRRR